MEATRALMQEDLPAPVAPAMSTWGSSARCSIIGWPEMFIPSPTESGWLASSASGLRRMSPRVTRRRCRLGTSTPMALRPGMGARIRTSGVARA